MMVTGILKRKSFLYKVSFFTVLSILIVVLILALHNFNTTPAVREEQQPSQAVLFQSDPPLTSVSTIRALDILYVENNLDSLYQKDPQLIQYVRARHLTPPSKLSYNLKEKEITRDEYSGWVADFFKGKNYGIFIEAGANEGEISSHTLYLEKELGWTGLLVECNPTVVPYLRTKHRKAWIADVCLSPSDKPAILNFSNPTNWTYSGTLRKPGKIPVPPTDWKFFDVQAIPLYSILAALGWKEVDYFSFDIEGKELDVLKNFSFELVIFKVLIVEVAFYSQEEKVELDNLLKSKGYIFVRDIEWDKIYVHQNFKDMIPSEWNFW